MYPNYCSWSEIVNKLENNYFTKSVFLYFCKYLFAIVNINWNIFCLLWHCSFLVLFCETCHYDRDVNLNRNWDDLQEELWYCMSSLKPAGRTRCLQQDSVVATGPSLKLLFPSIKYFLYLCRAGLLCGLAVLHVQSVSLSFHQMNYFPW